MYKKIILITLLLWVNGCGDSEDKTKKVKAFQSKEKLGESLFFDTNLSLESSTSSEFSPLFKTRSL